MRKHWALLLAGLLLLSLCPLCAPGLALAAADCAIGEALVLYAPTAARDGAAQGDAQLFGADVSIENVWSFADSVAQNDAATASGASSGALCVAHVTSALDTQALLTRLSALSFVLYAEPNARYTPDSLPHDPGYDPYIPKQWGVDGDYGIHPEALWPGASGAVIAAVIDTGVDERHPELQNRLADASLTFDAYPAPGVPAGRDLYGHGTHVAGIIAAQSYNGAGMAGVAGTRGVALMNVKVTTDKGISYASDIIAGMTHIIEKKNAGAPIVAANMSLGSDTSHSSHCVSYVEEKLTAAGVVLVRSAGNAGVCVDDHGAYPNLYEAPGVIGVAAIRSDGVFDRSLMGAYSNYSPNSIHIAAPGNDILSTWPLGMKGGYVDTQSFSAHSAGVRAYDDFSTSKQYAVRVSRRAMDGSYTQVLSDGVLPRPDPDAPGSYILELPTFTAEAYTDYRVEIAPIFTYGPWHRWSDDATDPETLAIALRTNLAQVNAALSDSFTIATGYLTPNVWAERCTVLRSDNAHSLWLSTNANEGSCIIALRKCVFVDKEHAAFSAQNGTSMAAPHVTGAVALLSLALPNASAAELRARVLGSSRPDASLADRVSTGGSLDLRHAASADTTDFAPVLNSITQDGSSIQVDGYFFGGAPTLTLAGQSVPIKTQQGEDGVCALTFTLPQGVSGVQTLTMTKANGRSFRLRYDYDALGNMTPLGAAPQANAASRELFSYNNILYALYSTPAGFSVYRRDGDWTLVGSHESLGDTPTRTEFSTYIQDGILYLFDYAHLHRYDIARGVWLTDIDGPVPLPASVSQFNTGAIASFGGRLLLLGGSYNDASRYTRACRDAVWVYENGGWHAAEGFPGNIKLGTARAIECGGKLFVTGKTSTGDDVLLRYDGSAWVSLTCPADLSRASLAIYENTLLCFGDADAENGILRYDPATDAWSRLPYWGAGLPYSARGAVVGRRIYALTALQTSQRYVLQYVDTTPGPAPAPQAGGAATEPLPAPTPVPVPLPPATDGGDMWGRCALCALAGGAALLRRKRRDKKERRA